MSHFIAVNPDGKAMGPVGMTYEFVKDSLIIGFERAAGFRYIDREVTWRHIKSMGYKIHECEIVVGVEVADPAPPAKFAFFGGSRGGRVRL